MLAILNFKTFFLVKRNYACNLRAAAGKINSPKGEKREY
jgi:hypothetical protein